MITSRDLTVDQALGSAYQVVRYVAANMDTLIQLSDAIPLLTTYMPDIQAVLAQMSSVVNVSDNMTAVISISNNMAAVLNLNTNMAALQNINTNMAGILAVPSAIAAQDWKNSVVVATTANNTLFGVQTIDGITLAVGNRVLVKDQTISPENGIYVVSTGYWTRATDAVSPNVSTNNVVMVDQGVVNRGKQFRLTTTGIITVGTTSQIWGEVVSGEVNTISNQGTGIGIGMDKVGRDLPLKTLKAGSNVVLTDNGSEIEISSTGGGDGGGGSGEANTTSNAGTGEGQLAKPKSGLDLPIKSIKAGANIVIVNNSDDVTISSTGEANTSSNVGTGVGLAKPKASSDLPFKSLKAGSNVTIDDATDEVTINATAPSVIYTGGTGCKVAVAHNTFYNSIVPCTLFTNSTAKYFGGRYPEAFPIPVYGPFTINQVSVSRAVAVAGETTTLRIAIYSADPVTGLPTTKLAEGSRTSEGSTDLKVTLATPLAIQAGLYWVAIWLDVGRTLESMPGREGCHFGDYNCMSMNTQLAIGDAFPSSITEVNASPWGYSEVPVIGLFGV